MKKCSVEGCNCKHHAKGYCKKHYSQYKRHGKILENTKYDPNEIIEYEDHAEIILYNKNYEEVGRALIDLEDIDKVKNLRWCLNGNGYVLHGTNKNKAFLHRLLIDCPDDMMVDHINRNPLDNRKSNLRIVNNQQNSMNKGAQRRNTSGHKGVSWDKSKNKWYAYITVNYKLINLGRFSILEDAVEARKQAEIKYFGKYRSKRDDDNE